MTLPIKKLCIAAAALITFSFAVPLSAQDISMTNLLAGDSARATGINNEGQVVGQNGSIPGGFHSFLVTPQDTDLDGTPDLWVQDDDGDGINNMMDDLGTFFGGSTKSEALDVNDLGQVVGYSTYAQNEFTFNAFIWTESGGMVNLGTNIPIPIIRTRARGINNLGQVVGEINMSPVRAFIIDPLDANLDGIPDTWFLDDGIENGLMISLGTLGGPWSGASDINDDGMVVGWSYDPVGNTRAFIIPPEDMDADGVPDTWFSTGSAVNRNGLMIDLGTLGGIYSEAYGINNRGQVVGESETASKEIHAFLITPEYDRISGNPILWYRDDDGDGRNDLMIDLGAFGERSSAYAINNLGQIAGSVGPVGAESAYLWNPDLSLVDLGALGGISSAAFSINDSGVVVGQVTFDNITKAQAALWIVSPVQGGGNTDSVTIDIKPGSCKNPLNVKSRGVLTVAILGSEGFDVTRIDPESVRLMGGAAPLRWHVEDEVSQSAPSAEIDDTSCGEGPDGFPDLMLKFDTQTVVSAIEAHTGLIALDGEELVLFLTGNMLAESGGDVIEGEDVVHINNSQYRGEKFKGKRKK